MSVIVSGKGWIVIPAELRKKYNLRAGTEVVVVDYGAGKGKAMFVAADYPFKRIVGVPPREYRRSL